jgi:hypothetical protein
MTARVAFPFWRLAASTLAAFTLLASAPALRAQAIPQQSLAAQQVQQLAPQLLAFTGSAANFQSLVNGLSLGTPVVLSTIGTDGIARTVTFTPPGGLSALQVAQTLEAARQQLVTQGVATPTGEQIGATLLGGPLATPSGIQPVTGVLPQQTTPAAADLQRGALTAQQVQQLAPQLLAFSGSAANFQSLVNGLSLGTPVTLTTPGAGGSTQTVTFTPAGGASAQQIAQTLEAARQQLIAQGIGTPTGEQIGVTVMGGTLNAANGSQAASTALGTRASQPGISTSASPFFGTSDSPVVGTSASPIVGTSNTPVLPNATTQPPGTGAATTGTGASVGATIPRPALGGATGLTAPRPALGGATGAATTAPNGPASPAAQLQGRR